ncbi:putative G-protein coupled receptor 156 [Acipenser oxyrinchus oxyrinchus]|uniref:G-protein coupled receptor 156 n=1 Tax=Acipenser oxyrinchus oxyrinchus TaxID=40147 RepID=A0AAD8G902_ACIOX|nr:putative G-protein coupled receptor 156 [Acipenser oxyrinchus oxyrinchus]
MEPISNCSDVCGSTDCSFDPGINTEEGWNVLQKLCKIAITSSVNESRISPALCSVIWVLLSCGILLAIFFLAFTLRFKSNRIVKMSSPNLNVVTLFGSVLTYSSGFMFGIEESTLLPGTAMRTLLQARIWTLCIGTSLVFGPILGKTWRLYKVFTQRMPDKRVIIKDIQLMGLVAGLMLVDVVFLTTWGLTDPVQCMKSISAALRVSSRDVSYSMSDLETCASVYTDVWIILISVLKGSLLLYGTYLAGLTSNVSSPPVNQTLTIMAGVYLITLSAGVTIPVTRFFYTWPNLVYSFISGAIFICTLTINCLVFIPQLTQWKQFADELNQSPRQMAKYFSSPSKSIHSMYSEEEIYCLLGENSSMKRLLTEKNAVIESLQEQVNNAKDKLMKLMPVHCGKDHTELNSTTKSSSAFTQITEVRLEGHSQGTEDLEIIKELCSSNTPSNLESKPAPPKDLIFTSVLERNRDHCSSHDLGSVYVRQCCDTPSHIDTELHQLGSKPVSNLHQNLQNNKMEKDLLLTSSDSGSALHMSPKTVAPESSDSTKEQLMANKHNYVSSEKLQEILQDLSIDAVSSLRSPARTRKDANTMQEADPSRMQKEFQFYFQSISPYIMRKRRPPFNPMRGGTPPYCFPGYFPPHARCVASNELVRKHNNMDTRTKPNSDDLLPPNTASKDVDQLPTTSKDEPSSYGSQLASVRRAKCANRCDYPEGYSDSHKESEQACICSIKPLSGFNSKGLPCRESEIEDLEQSLYDYSDSDSSSSEEDFCYYHKPYYDTYFQGPYESTESNTSETSDSELGGSPAHWVKAYSKAHPVVNFKEDLKPTFV